MLELLQSLLWFNDDYRVTFTRHKARNNEEYLWFTYDIATGIRQHRYYSVVDDKVLIEFDGELYKVKELKARFIGNIMIQLENVDIDLDIINFMGTHLPVIHGAPYRLQEVVQDQ